MAKQYIAVTVIKNGTKILNPGDEMPERFVKASERDALVNSGALRIEDGEQATPSTDKSTDKPTEAPTEPPAGEDSDGTESGN